MPQMYVEYRDGEPVAYRYGEEWVATQLFLEGGYPTEEEAIAVWERKKEMATFEEKKALRDQGLTYREIAEILGVSTQAVAQALGKGQPSQFQYIKPTGCIYEGLRNWMNENKVSRGELVRRMGKLPYAASKVRLDKKLTGKSNLGKPTIDKILQVTGLTYEQAFCERDGADNG